MCLKDDISAKNWTLYFHQSHNFLYNMLDYVFLYNTGKLKKNIFTKHNTSFSLTNQIQIPNRISRLSAKELIMAGHTWRDFLAGQIRGSDPLKNPRIWFTVPRPVCRPLTYRPHSSNFLLSNTSVVEIRSYMLYVSLPADFLNIYPWVQAFHAGFNSHRHGSWFSVCTEDVLHSWVYYFIFFFHKI